MGGDFAPRNIVDGALVAARHLGIGLTLVGVAADLIDGLTIFTVPVVLGGGKKLFADGSAPHAYKLTRSRVSSTGIMIAHYERGGGVKTGDTALESPSQAEAARQERMKREG